MLTESVVNHFGFSKWWSVLEAYSSGHAKEFCIFMMLLVNFTVSVENVNIMQT